MKQDKKGFRLDIFIVISIAVFLLGTSTYAIVESAKEWEDEFDFDDEDEDEDEDIYTIDFDEDDFEFLLDEEDSENRDQGTETEEIVDVYVEDQEGDVDNSNVFPGFRINYNDTWILNMLSEPYTHQGEIYGVAASDISKVKNYKYSLRKGDVELLYEFYSMGPSVMAVYGWEGYDFCSNTLIFNKLGVFKDLDESMKTSFGYRIKTYEGYRYTDGSENISIDEEMEMMSSTVVYDTPYKPKIDKTQMPWEQFPVAKSGQNYKFCSYSMFPFIDSNIHVKVDHPSYEKQDDYLVYALGIKILGHDEELAKEADEIVRNTIYGN